MRQDKTDAYRIQFAVQWAILAIVLAASFGLVAYELYVERTNATLREHARLLAQARVVDQNLAKQLESTDKVLTRLRDELARRFEGNRFPADGNSRLAALELAIPGVRTLLALDADGVVRLSNRPELIGINVSWREYFMTPREFPDSGRLFVSRPFKTVLGAWGINLTRVVIGRKGEFAGVVTATLDAQYFSTLLSSISYAPDLRAVLVHGDGDIFLMVPEVPPIQGRNLAQPDSFFALHTLSGWQENVYSGQTFATGEMRMVALRTIKPGGVPLDKPLVAMVTRDLDAVYQGWYRQGMTIAILLALTLLLTGSALAIFQRRQRFHLERIERADADLREAGVRLQLATDAAGIGVWQYDMATRRLALSEKSKALLGYDAGAGDDDWPEHIHPDDRSGLLDEFSASVNHGQGFSRVVRMRRRDGGYGWFLVKGKMAAQDGEGGPQRLIGTLSDVTERKQAEAALRASEERWSFALEGGGDCVWDWNLQTGEVTLSKAGKRMFGYADDEVADRIEEWEMLAHPDDKTRITEDLKAYLQGRTPTLVSEYRVQCKGGHWKWILTRGMAVARDADGRVTRMIGTHADISERREREEALKLAGVVLETIDEGVVVTDAQSRIVSVNPGFTEITGYPQEEVLGRTPKLLSAGTHTADFYRGMWETLRNTGSWKGEVLNRKKNGEFYVEWLSIKQLRDERGEVSHYVGVFSDISERKASEERMRHLAHCDALTGLANRMLLTDRIHQTLSKARRDRKRAAVLFVDLDRFKPVNDQFGHDVGDLLLQQVAQRVLACVRESDTVARLGGDEFVVLLTEIEEEANALAVGRKILDALQRPFDPLGHLVTIGASIGVAVFPEHGGDETALLKNADIAMYKAKACGRNTVIPFTNDTAHERA